MKSLFIQILRLLHREAWLGVVASFSPLQCWLFALFESDAIHVPSDVRKFAKKDGRTEGRRLKGMRKEIGKELKKENTMYLVTPPHCSCWASSFHLFFSASSRSLLLFATCQILASPPEYPAAGESVSRRQVQSKVLGWPEPVQGGLSWRRHLARLAYPSVFLYACMFTYNLVCLLH